MAKEVLLECATVRKLAPADLATKRLLLCVGPNVAIHIEGILAFVVAKFAREKLSG